MFFGIYFVKLGIPLACRLAPPIQHCVPWLKVPLHLARICKLMQKPMRNHNLSSLRVWVFKTLTKTIFNRSYWLHLYSGLQKSIAKSIKPVSVSWWNDHMLFIITVFESDLDFRQAWKSGQRCARKDWTTASFVILKLLPTWMGVSNFIKRKGDLN